VGDRLKPIVTGTIDALAAPTLKHVRDLWWDDSFTEFLVETLRPRPGNLILDVGCGEGQAEVSIGRRQVSQVRLVGVDLVPAKAAATLAETRSHNQRVSVAAGDAVRLPFQNASFDATFCVAVLQYVADVSDAVKEIARVTAPGRRVVIVEPDNAGRYFFSSVPSGALALQAATRFFAALAEARDDVTHPSVGPRVPSLLDANRVEPVDVRMFPVSHVQLGAPPEELWAERRKRVQAAMSAPAPRALSLAGEAFLGALDAYQRDAALAGSSFVEIQNTMLFATVGQKPASAR
jgi:SAM-dependent methyltransferase